ncbi:SRCN1 inhibitor, partial [Smithornis capensis]|nr:SRCN1 inhibitor [Smithornis capensis]
VAPETDFSKGLDLEMPTSPPVSLHHLPAATEPLGMPSFGHSPPQTQSHPSKSNNPSRAPEMVPAKTQTGPETPSKKSADKAVSVEAAERDWEEKRAALTQYISLGFVHRALQRSHLKYHPGTEHPRLAVPHVLPLLATLEMPKWDMDGFCLACFPPGGGRTGDGAGRGQLKVQAGGLMMLQAEGLAQQCWTSSRGQEVPLHLRRRDDASLAAKPCLCVPTPTTPAGTGCSKPPSSNRPCLTPQVFQRSSASPFLPKLRPAPLVAVSPGLAELWPNGASVAAEGWKEPLALAAAGSRAFSLPQIVLTEWVSEPPSPEAEPEVWVDTGSGGAGGELAPKGARKGRVAPGSPEKSLLAEGHPPAAAPQPPSSTSRGRESAAGEILGFPVAASKALPFPGDKRSHPTPGQGGDTAVNAASREEGGSDSCHRGHKGEAAGAGAGEAALPCTGIIPQLPSDVEPQAGARQSVREASLPPGDSTGASKPAPVCPVPNPGVFPGRDPAPRGKGESRAEQPLEQVAVCSRPSHDTAFPGWDGGAPAAAGDSGMGGKVPEGLHKGPLSPCRSTTPGCKEIYEDTYQRLDSLEETIRELEMTISEISSHPSVESVFPKELLGQTGSKEADKETNKGLGDLKPWSCDVGTVLDLSQAKDDAPKSPSPSKTKPPLLPKPQLPPGIPQSGGVSIPAMKVVNPASRLKQSQQGSPDKSKHIKQRMEYMRIQGQQQVVHP